MLLCELPLEEPKTLLKNPGRSFTGAGAGVAGAGPLCTATSLDFSYPIWGAGAESRSRAGTAGALSRGLGGLRPEELFNERLLRLCSRGGGSRGAGGGGGTVDIVGIVGIDGSRRGPPGTVGVGAASYSSARKLLGNSTRKGVGSTTGALCCGA